MYVDEPRNSLVFISFSVKYKVTVLLVTQLSRSPLSRSLLTSGHLLEGGQEGEIKNNNNNSPPL